MTDLNKLIKQNKRYPTSINNRQCLGPCYEANTFIIHPLTQMPITVKNAPFCPVEPYETINPVTKQRESNYTDECSMPTIKKDVAEEITQSILLPTTEFDCSKFLRLYYDIYTFEDTLLWLEDNKHAQFDTKMRILNCAFKSFGPDIEIMDNTLIELFTTALKTEWMRYIYNEIISKYIHIENDQFIIKKTDRDRNNKIEKINYFTTNYINNNNIYKLLQNYLKDNKKKWHDINSHNRSIRDYSISFFKKLLI